MLLNFFLAVSFALPQAEFAKYHREITGRDPAPNAISFAIDPKVSKTGHDAYALKSTRHEAQGTKYEVTITGSNERSVWYGLYDLLERRGGCRWFWDGDVVPKKDAIDLSGLDVREEAAFEYRGLRYFAHRGLTRFQAEHWGPEDWRREIDWCLKRRLNVFMLRIGQDDLFQRAFPETCKYPDASKDLPGHGEGYDNRTLFWSLEYRGKLRARIQKYAFARGLMVPEDFGTMTHWYSRTPEDFLDGKNPPFLPQATEGYAEKNGLVWDIRDPKWVDEYWQLTKTACDTYGEGRDQQLLHTIGLGERRCFKDRKDNHELKKFALRQFLDRARRDYPNAKRLLAGWDFYFTWHPEEVQDLVQSLDPEHDIIWDYEGDSTRDHRPEMKDIGGNNFTKWGVVGKFPYTYSIFLAFESALDIRANYPLIEARQKIVQNDPKCAGYIFWPESSHTDTLLLRYFTANAWGRNGAVPVGEVLDEFCVSRYGADAAAWKRLWQKVIPASHLFDWCGNYAQNVVVHETWMDASEWLGTPANRYNDGKLWQAKKMPKELVCAADVFRGLAALDWKKSAFTERDAIDLARTMADRLICYSRDELLKAYHAWRADDAERLRVSKGASRGDSGDAERLRVSKGASRGDSGDAVSHRVSKEKFLDLATAYKAMGDAMADLLALHTDYSLAESYDRLDAVEKIRNPNFPKVLVENAICEYCASHQYEAAAYWYKPSIRDFADDLARRVKANDRSDLGPYPKLADYRDAHMYAKPLAAMRPTLPRTQANYRDVLERLAKAADAFILRDHKPLDPLVCPAPKKVTMGQVGEDLEWIPLDGSIPVAVACEDAAAADWVKRHWKAWFLKDVEVKSSATRRDSASPGEADNMPSATRRDSASPEKYTLSISKTEIKIGAKGLAGVRYAMATLRQLAMANRGTLKLTHYIAPVCEIEDEPSVRWRGLHYCWFPEMRVASVERFIRMAAYLKFNYVILESWGTFRSEKFPWLGWADGAMTKAELKRLRGIADDLGVMLIPEVNVFGHGTYSRGCAGKHAVLDFAPEYQPLFEPVMGWNWCLTNPETKRVLKELLSEMHEAFGNPPYFHIGCDEAQSPSCPECTKGSYSEKVIAHIRTMADHLQSRGARAIVWHDMFLRAGDPRFPASYCNGSPAMAAHLEELPKSVIIADWYYGPLKPETDRPSLRHFHDLGFDVLTCPWNDESGMMSQGRFAQENPWCGYLGTLWHHNYGPDLRKVLVCGASAAWGSDPEPFRWPRWDMRIMSILRHIQWDMPIRDRIDSGVFDRDLIYQPASMD